MCSRGLSHLKLVYSWQRCTLRKIPSSDAGFHGCILSLRRTQRVLHQVNVRDSRARSKACWKCRGLGHFQKDCKATLNFQGGDNDDLALSDTNPTISQMSHTLTISTLTTDLTFNAILKEFVSLVFGNRKTFHPKPQNTLKNISQTSTSGASPTAMPVLTTVTSTSSPQTMSQLAPSMISSGSTSLPANSGRGPP